MTRRIAIVGGGILGCAIASRLLDAERDAKVTLIDSALAGSGASQYSAGVHFPVGRSERVRRLSAVSAEYYAAILAQHPDLPIHPLDFLMAAPAAHAEDAISRCMGLDALSPGERIRLSQDVGRDYALWRMRSCHVADVQKLALWFAHRIRHHADVLEGVRVEHITETDAGIRLALSTGKVIDVDDVVLAPGPWVNDAPFREWTAGLDIRIKKVVALHLDRPLDHCEAVLFLVEDAFLAPLPHRGHWLFSYTCGQWDVSPDACRRASVESRDIDEAHGVLSRIAPGLMPLAAAGRVFCDAYSPDGEPVVRKLGRGGKIILAGAANGSGYRLAPGIALEVADILAASC
jgi:glycine/D-amino acid oxidase-like deaminating enzyme